MMILGSDPALEQMLERISEQSGVPLGNVPQMALLLYELLLAHRADGLALRLEDGEGKLFAFEPQAVQMDAAGVERLWPLFPK